ncbi:MAG: phenylalanine--tRNA ligase subunit beta [Burkholderiaceae bacterium]
MQFPESWLRSFVNPSLTTDELSHRLTMAGLEVEETEPAAPPFSNIVVALIETVEPHPNADKLRLCRVSDGTGTPLQIVCGAPNAQAGTKVPLARIGAVLPGGMQIGTAKMRGVESSGMLCSARELGLSQDHAGLLILDDRAPVGASLRDVLNLDDTLFTLKLTPNRADCLSILGVAREVAALTGTDLCLPDVQPVAVTLNDRIPVDVQAPDLCGRFAGRVIRGVNARAATPDWMRTRLERAGQRSVSALVDISNYVMLELGRPTHVFDLQRISGGLTVRWAQQGEQLELLNGQTVTLDPFVGVIAAGSQVESMAGIMGGEATAVTLDTTDIYLEAAFWWPEAIMGRARRYKFSSEASHRFERGVDFESIPDHIERMTRLIVDICGGQVGPVDDQIINLPERKPVSMRLSRCHKVLGVAVPRAEVERIFASLGLAFQVESGDTFVVQPPSYRFDLFIEEDLIEEVARVYGFERIPDIAPLARADMRVPAEVARGPHALRAAVAALDYQEVINFSFVEEAWERDYVGNDNPIRLLNPIASQLAVMRSSLIGGLLANIVHNANRKQTRVRVFELGRVFSRDGTVADGDLTVAGIDQPQRIAGAAWGPALDEQWGIATRRVDFYDVKRDIEALLGVRADGLRCESMPHPALHPGRSARLSLDGGFLGWLGELHPRWVQQLELSQAPVVFELDAQALSATHFPQPAELSRQPVVVRDLAVWASLDTRYQDLIDTLAQTARSHANLGILKDIKLFDVWRDAAAGTEEKSLAFRFWFQSKESTLDDATIEHCVSTLLQALVQAHGVRQRA